MARILAISSLVARGRVGNSIAVPVLEAMGHEVWSLPTILLSTRPGLGTVAGQDIPPALISRFVESHAADDLLRTVDAVLTGYLPSTGHVEAAAGAVDAVKAANPDALHLCDPVMGDGDRGLYIDAQAAEAIRDRLLRRADVLTPNVFELELLSGNRDGTSSELAEALPPPVVAVTSGSQADGIENLLVSTGTPVVRRGERFAGVPNGTGDLFSALMLGNLLVRANAEEAFLETCDRLQEVARASAGHDVLQIAGLFHR